MASNPHDRERGEEIRELADLEAFLDDMIEEVEGWEADTEVAEVYAHVATVTMTIDTSIPRVLTSKNTATVALNSRRARRLKRRVSSWASSLQSKLAQIAKNQNAESYTVTVGTPFSVSVAITWDA